MTITTTGSVIAYEGNGVATTFSFNFLIPSQDNLVITITDPDGGTTVLLTSEYSVTGIDDPDGGIVTYPLSGSPLAVEYFITIARELPLTQETSLQNQSGYYPEVVEAALDNIVMQIQQVSSDHVRALVAPDNDPAGNLTIPDASARAGALLGFDLAGDPIAASTASGANVSSVMVPVVEAASLAAARSLLGFGAAGALGVGTGLRSDGTDITTTSPTTAESTSQSVTSAYNGTTRIATGPFTYTLDRANTLWNGFTFYVFALTGAITFAPNAADAMGNLSVGTSLVIQPGTFARVTTNGAASGVWYVDAHVIGNNLNSGATMLNGVLVESHAVNAATYAIKTVGGTDPSTMDPVIFLFRSATAGTGTFVVRVVTGALSITIPNTATMGFGNSVAGRIWLTAIDNAGTVELAVINCLTISSSSFIIYPLQGWGIVSTTILNTASDNAQVMYSASARTSVAYLTLGYFSYESGLAAAGAWAASPTRIQLAGYGVPLPGMVVQVQSNLTTTLGSTTSTTYVALSSGQTQAIALTSAANVVKAEASGNTSNNASTQLALRMSRGTVAATNLFGSEARTNFATGTNVPVSLLGYDQPNTTSSTTYAIQGKSSGGNTINYPDSGAPAAVLSLTEIMA